MCVVIVNIVLVTGLPGERTTMSAQTRLNEALPESQQRLSHQATTLATHGYIVGDVIGQGTYAVVKVKRAGVTPFGQVVSGCTHHNPSVAESVLDEV